MSTLPPSNSAEAAASIHSVFVERGHPCSPMAAARCGWEAAHRYATKAVAAQAAELEALRDELRLCCELKREYQEQVASKVDEVEALRKRAETWELLYMRAINEANGLTNYVEDRPELSKIERKLVAIEAAARAALKEQTPNDQHKGPPKAVPLDAPVRL